MILRYEILASHIYDSLKKIPRTGWVMHRVPNPETVYDHTVSLVTLADEFSKELGLSESELDDLKHIVEIHDWAEALVGDEFIPNENKASYEETKLKKAERERKGLAFLLEGHTYKDVVMQLFDRYEQGSDTIAILAKELDKFQALSLAGEYELKYNIPLFDEFYQYYVRDNSFHNPILLKKIAELRKRLRHGDL